MSAVGLISEQLLKAWEHIDSGYGRGLPLQFAEGMNLLIDAITRLERFEREVLGDELYEQSRKKEERA